MGKRARDEVHRIYGSGAGIGDRLKLENGRARLGLVRGPAPDPRRLARFLPGLFTPFLPMLPVKGEAKGEDDQTASASADSVNVHKDE
jgi:hypothetical protein